MGGREKSGGDDERRRDPRYARSLPIVVHDRADGVRAESINVSSRGLYCRVERYVEPFSKLKVVFELPFPGAEPSAVECDGVVVRVEPEQETPGVRDYCVAIYFLNLGQEEAALIEEFLAATH